VEKRKRWKIGVSRLKKHSLLYFTPLPPFFLEWDVLSPCGLEAPFSFNKKRPSEDGLKNLSLILSEI
jgi:hypothetical protein